MCGIVGAIAERNITPILVEGLKRLEYRGYDSAGVAVIQADGALFLRLEHRNAVAGDGFFALALDLQAAVVFDVLLQIALGVEVDVLQTFAVFDAQFVVAAPTWSAAAT